jgi:MerR family mercuric resistance operon transcriptional regulator
MYSIGQLAKKANVSNRTLRYYEELGLIVPKSRGSNRYRYYDESHMQRLGTIKMLQDSGFALKEIVAALAPIFEPGSQITYTGQEVGCKIFEALENQRNLLLERQKEIAKTLEELSGMMNGLKSCFGCQISRKLDNCADCPTGPKEVRRIAQEMREFQNSTPGSGGRMVNEKA